MNYIATCKRGITLLFLLAVYSQGMSSMAFADELSKKHNLLLLKLMKLIYIMQLNKGP